MVEVRDARAGQRDHRRAGGRATTWCGAASARLLGRSLTGGNRLDQSGRMPPGPAIPRRATLALPFLARPAWAQAPLLRIGSKNFTEQLVVAELFAQALEAAGAQGRAPGQPRRHRDRAAGAAAQRRDRPLPRIHRHRPRRGAEAEARGHGGRGAGQACAPATGAVRPHLARRPPASTTAMRCWCCRHRAAARPRHAVGPRPRRAATTLAAGNEFADRADGLPGLRASTAWNSAASGNSPRSACAMPRCSTARPMW